MKTHSDPRLRPHLVTDAPKSQLELPGCGDPPPSNPEPDDKEARMIADGVLKLQALQDEFDTEIMSGHGNLERVGELLTQLNLVRERLRAHGVRVRA